MKKFLLTFIRQPKILTNSSDSKEKEVFVQMNWGCGGGDC